MILAGDVGGTKILLEAGDFRSGRWRPLLARRYLIAEFDHFYAVIERFLAEWDAVKPRRARLTAAAFGVAGPVVADKVQMTHSAWRIEGAQVTRRVGIPRVRIVNDLAAAAHGLADLSSRDFMKVQAGKAAPREPRVVLGVGTGLGVAYLVPGRDGYHVVPGEGGHMGFSPGSAEQAELWRDLFAGHARVEAERVCSGIGISNIYESLRQRSGASPGANRADPAWISRNAIEQSDPMCINALDIFAECLGNVAGDHALAVMARGGVYLAGGVIAKLAPVFNAARFRSAFCAKDLFATTLMATPVKIVTTERLPLIGAARVAESR